MKRQELHSGIYYYLSLLIAFFLPSYIYVVPVFIVLLFANWIIEGNFSDKFFRLKSNRFAHLFILFYLLFLFGMFWTENKNAGWFDLQVKLSVFVFPVIFSSISFCSQKNINKILFSFVMGCLLATIYCFSYAIYKWNSTGDNYFLYTKLSVILHPSYLAMYLSFSIVVLSFQIIKKKYLTGKLFFDVLLVVWFWFNIIMLQSKAGIMITGILFIVLLISYLITSRKLIPVIIVLIFIGGGYYLINRYIVTANNSRILVAVSHISERKIDAAFGETSEIRILIWETALDVIKNNVFLGVGTGDVKDELTLLYKKKNMQTPYDFRLNAHNQYIQSAVGLGLMGFVLIIFNFLFPFLHSVRKRKFLYVLFILIVSLNLLVESMLETQAGVVFYAFFNSLLLFGNDSTDEK